MIVLSPINFDRVFTWKPLKNHAQKSPKFSLNSVDDPAEKRKVFFKDFLRNSLMENLNGKLHFFV